MRLTGPAGADRHPRFESDALPGKGFPNGMPGPPGPVWLYLEEVAS